MIFNQNATGITDQMDLLETLVKVEKICQLDTILVKNFSNNISLILLIRPSVIRYFNLNFVIIVTIKCLVKSLPFFAVFSKRTRLMDDECFKRCSFVMERLYCMCVHVFHCIKVKILF